MDRVLRNYAHSAWTPADPLDGVDPETRRAILLMPSTFRERWRLAPWTTRHQRRAAIAEIVAERRIAYELTHRKLAPAPTIKTEPEATIARPEALSPYYQYRLGFHPEAIAAMRADRTLKDRRDISALPQARADFDRRLERRRALIEIELQRADLDAKEIRLLADAEASVADPPSPRPKPKKSKAMKPDRGRSM